METIESGRGDVRAVTAILDRVYADDVHVEEPNTLDELHKLTRVERRRLYRQLQAEGRAPALTVEDMREALAKDEAERRAELGKLSQEDRRILADDLAAIEST